MNDAAAIGTLIGTLLGRNYAEKQLQGDIDKGTDYINQEATNYANTLSAMQANQKAQEELALKQKFLETSKQWADYDAAGVASNDPRRQQIIDDSQKWRKTAEARGIALPGQDVDYNTARTMFDTSGRDTIKKLSDAYVKAGYADAAKYAPVSDMGHDAGANNTQQPFDLGASLNGIDKYAQLAQAKYADPGRYKTNLLSGLNSLGIGESAMQKLAPLYESTVKNSYDQRGVELIGQYQTETDPMKKAQIVQLYNSLYGGKVDLKDLAPKTGMATADTGDQIDFVKTTQPNAYGMGDTSANVIGSINKGINPGTKEQLNLQERTLAQNDKHFYANFGLQQQKLQNDTINDAARIQQAQKNSSLSGYGTLLSDLRGRAGNSLRAAQDIIAAHKNDYDKYNPQDDPEVQKHMQNYQAFSQQADSISNQLGSAMGLNIGGRQQNGKTITEQEKSVLNNKYTDEQLRQAGYTW